jgi:hypothetical protein
MISALLQQSSVGFDLLLHVPDVFSITMISALLWQSSRV